MQILRSWEIRIIKVILFPCLMAVGMSGPGWRRLKDLDAPEYDCPRRRNDGRKGPFLGRPPSMGGNIRLVFQVPLFGLCTGEASWRNCRTQQDLFSLTFVLAHICSFVLAHPTLACEQTRFVVIAFFCPPREAS